MVTAEKAIVIYTMGNTDGLHSHQRLLLCAADYTGLPVSTFQRIQDEGQKPQLEGGPELHFSVSHSGEHWVCAFGPQPLGLDLQQHRPCRTEALARRFFHPQEVAWLEGKDFSEESFYHIWTAKESWVKQSGHGFGKGFSDFSVLDPQTASRCRHIPFLPNYTMCLCCSHIDLVLFKHLEQNKGGFFT
jgi:4'-phosphopantetheinyl transferase